MIGTGIYFWEAFAKNVTSPGWKKRIFLRKNFFKKFIENQRLI